VDTPIATDSLVLGHILTRHAHYRHDHAAVIFGNAHLTYGQFNVCLNRWSNALASLVLCGDGVAKIPPNSVELLTTYWACAKLGAAAVPLSPLLLALGLVSLLNDAKPRVVVGTRDFATILTDIRPRLTYTPAPSFVLIDSDAPDFFNYAAAVTSAASDIEPDAVVETGDVVTVMYTSGTTGLPKGILHTHFIRAMYAGLMASTWRMAPECKVLHTGAIVFNGAMVTLLPTFYCGATYILHKQFDTDATLETIAAERVTHTMVVPSQIVAMLNSPRFDPAKLQSLEMIFVARRTATESL
jgi:long-chain acyl-CoA synthetase